MSYRDKIDKPLAIFDVEGVVLPKRRYLFLQATKNLGLLRILNLIFLGFLYEIGFLPLEIALKRVYRLFKGTSRWELYRTFKTIQVIPGVSQVFQELRKKGFQIALISSGLPDFLLEELRKEFNVDYAYGLKLEMEDEIFTGEISGEILKRDGKAIVLEHILKGNGYSTRECIVIADDRNNLPMFPLATKTIGYNPDVLTARKCDYAIKGNLLDIIPVLTASDKSLRVPYTRNDAFREVIHMGSYLIPILCHFLNISRFTLAAIILSVATVYALTELGRRMNINLPPFTTITDMAAIGEEKWEFATSPIFFALGISLSLLLYPPQIGFVAITILTLGDGTARFVGKNLGRIALPYNKMKNLEGSIVGIIVATLASLLFVPPFKALVASITGMVGESLPLPINDNILIPLVSGLVLLVML